MARKFSSWLDGFMEFTDPLPSPELFRRWAGIGALSSALERKIWTNPYGPNLYPNTYIILCGPAGAGKTTVTSQVQRFLRELPSHHTASSSLTKAALVDELTTAVRRIVRVGEDPPYVEFNFLSIIANELGVLIPAYDSDFMSALTDIWDGLGYSERRRSSKIEIDLPNAQFNLLTGTTPSYLAGTLPAGAWDQGFLSRTTVVFSGESKLRPIFAGNSLTSQNMFEALVSDFKEIASLFGKVRFTEGAVELITKWHMEGGPPAPDHPKLATYCSRRTAHLCKLCMILSASSRSDLLIDEALFIEALDLMTLTESFMPDIFKAMNTGGDARAIEEVWYFAIQAYTRDKKPIAEGRLINFLAEKVPAYSITKILDVMTKAGILDERLEPGIGKCFIPRPKR